MVKIKVADWDRSKLSQILKDWKGRKILVVGDVGVDRYTIGSVERISPEAPVPIVFVEEEQLKLGLAANVADNVTVLGGVPLLVGVVGQDRSCEDFLGILKKAGISISHLVTDKTRRTVLKERVVSEHQQLLRVDYESTHPLNSEIEAEILKKVNELVSQVDAVVLEDYAKGMLNSRITHEIFAAAKKAGKLTLVDPNGKSKLEMYKGASLLTPNKKEAELLSGIKITDDASLQQAGITLLQQTGAAHVIVTLGREGMAIFTAGQKECEVIPTYAREVYDVSGAGDTVIAVLALALTGGADLRNAAVLGNLAAGVEVGKRGTATVTVQEILDAMEFFGQS